MCVVQRIELQPKSSTLAVGMLWWSDFSIAECTYIKLFGEEALGSTQLTHQSSQALSSSLLTLPFTNIFGMEEGILCPALPFSMQLFLLPPTRLISASESPNNG